MKKFPLITLILFLSILYSTEIIGNGRGNSIERTKIFAQLDLLKQINNYLNNKIKRNFNLNFEKNFYIVPNDLEKIIIKSSFYEPHVKQKYSYAKYIIDKTTLDHLVDKFYFESVQKQLSIDLAKLNINQKINRLANLLLPYNYSIFEKEILNELINSIKLDLSSLQVFYQKSIKFENNANISIFITDKNLIGIDNIDVVFADSIFTTNSLGKVIRNINSSESFVFSINPHFSESPFLSELLFDSFPNCFHQEHKIDLQRIDTSVYIPNKYKSPELIRFFEENGFQMGLKNYANFHFDIVNVIFDSNKKNSFGNYVTSYQIELQIVDKNDNVVWSNSQKFEKFSSEKINVSTEIETQIKPIIEKIPD